MKFVKTFSALGILALGAAFTGCLNDSGSASQALQSGESRLVIRAGVNDVNKPGGLAKASVITLNKLVITMTSNIGTDSVIRDTIIANDSAGSKFKALSTSDQTFTKDYSVKPLRNWTIVVKTLDLNDSVIHFASITADSMLVGETRSIPMTLTSRFVMYEAKFTLPDSLTFTSIGVKQQLKISRVYMIVDGDTVADSTRLPRFNPSTVHTVRFDYMSVADTPDVQIEFHGTVGADTTVSKLFWHEFVNVNPTNTNPTPVTNPTYTGPSSSELSAITGLTIKIGKVGTVVFETIIDGNVTNKKAAH